MSTSRAVTAPALSTAQRWVLWITAIASFMVALDVLVVSTALSAIRTGLGASTAQLEWTINAYVLSFGVLMMSGAALGDRFGRRRVFAAGIALFAAASVGCALAPTVGWLIAARALQGAGGALVMPLSLALLGSAVTPEQRGRALGVFGSVSGFAVLCGSLLGGAVVEGISWPWVFWINVPIAIVLVPLAVRRIDESFGPAARLDVPGVILVTVAAGGLVWGLVRSTAVGWGSAEVVGALALGMAFAAAFVLVELRAEAPMLPPRLFRSRGFSAANGAMFFWFASMLGTLFFMAQFLQTVLGYGPLQTGLRLMPWGATTFIMPRVAGRLIGRVGSRPLVVGGLALQTGSMAVLAAIAAPDMAYGAMVVPLVLSGTGFAMALPAIQAAVLGAVVPEEVGKASGTLNTIRQLGGAFGVAITAAVFAAAGGYTSARAFSDGFAGAMAACAALALLGALAGAALPRPAPMTYAHATNEGKP